MKNPFVVAQKKEGDQVGMGDGTWEPCGSPEEVDNGEWEPCGSPKEVGQTVFAHY